MNHLSSPDPWTAVAGGYSGWTHEHTSRYAEDAVALLDPSAAARVLDVACGAGAATLPLAERVREVVGVDFSDAMLGILRGRLEEMRVANVTLHAGDGTTLPFPPSSFDAAVSNFGLIFFPDRAAGFRELHRCLRPGGRAAVTCWPPSSGIPALGWIFGGFAAGFGDLPPPATDADALDSAEKLVAEFEAAGFMDVAVHRLEHDIVVLDVMSFWQAMIDGSAPLVPLRRAFSEDEWARRHTAAIDHLRRDFRGPLSLSWPALCGVATKP